MERRASEALQQAADYGVKGDKGNGIESIELTSTVGAVKTYTITFTDGTTTTFNVMDGKDGTDGKDGKDGVDGKDGKDGVDGTDGKDGVDGKDGKDGADGDTGTTYTPAVSSAGVISWTNDGGKQNPQSVDMVAAVIAALPTWTGGAY